MAGTRRSLRGVNERLWAGGSLVSNIGTWIQRIEAGRLRLRYNHFD